MIFSQERLLQQVQGYIKRAKTDKDVPFYPLHEEGIFRIIGGTNDMGSASGLSLGERYHIERNLVRGRFVDAVAYAVQQDLFYGWHCSADNMDNSNHGMVIKINPKELSKNKTLDARLLALENRA